MPKELLNCSKLIGQRRSEYFGVGLSLCEVLKQGNSAFWTIPGEGPDLSLKSVSGFLGRPGQDFHEIESWLGS